MRSYGKMVFLGGLLTREEVDGYYDKCMELARGRGDREEIYNTSARYYRDRGDYERSTAYMDSLLTHYAETGKKADLGSIYIAQSHLYEKAGDYAKALEAMRKGNDFRYHSRMDQAQSKLAEMQALYDVNRLELEKSRLADRNKLFLLVAGGIVLLLAGWAAYQQAMVRRLKLARTQFMAASEEAQRQSRRAQESEKMKTAFINSMCHEIRTPLNAIVGFSGILASTDEEQEKQEYMSIIESNNTLLLQLISDILDLSKIEAGTLEFVHTDFELNKLMREKENVMRLKTDQNVELVFEQRYETCHVRTDRNRLSQLMINLLTNAAKFTHRGSIRFGYELRAGQLYFWVADTGCGIPAERKDAVFERFVKLNSFKQGTGLGLSICRTIVEHLGGNIGVESEEGKGSTFWFTLPYVPGKQEPAKIPAQMLQAVPTVEKDKLVILIAEDNESNYRLFESILRHEYKLVHAWNGREAVDLFNRHTPHLVLMDINMPVMDGYEATAEIRKQSADVPIIAVTAFAFASDEQKVLSSGFDGYMPKPINARQLKTQVLDMLRKRMTLI